MKLLFTDLDGTLLNQDKTISTELKHKLLQLLDKGHKLILTSGRPLASILQVKEQLGFNHPGVYIIAFNGALVYDCTQNKPLMECGIPLEYAQPLLDIVYENKVHCHTYTKTHILSEKQTSELDFYKIHVHLPVTIKENMLLHLDTPLYKLIAVDIYDHSKLQQVKQRIDSTFSSHIHTLFSSQYYLEIFSKDAGKGNAIKFLCNYLNAPIADSIAVGDAESDLSMIEIAGTGVAMKNACESLKSSADFITTYTNDEDGLLEVIEKFIL